MSKRMGFWSYFFIFIFVVMIIVALVFAYLELAKGEYVPGVDELQDKIDDLTKQNEDLQNKNENLVENENGISTGLFWAMIVSALILLLIFVNQYGSLGGRNVDRRQAQQIATNIVREDYGWHYFMDRPESSTKWVERTVQTGQAVEGDIDSLWYIVQFARDFPAGGDLAPGHQCITVGIKSNDASRQIHVEVGLNAREFGHQNKIRLQRNAQPSSLIQELQQLDVAGSVSENIRKITGEE